jgi:hypothetical protein
MSVGSLLRHIGLPPSWALVGGAVFATVVFYGGKALELLLDPIFEGFGRRTGSFLICVVLITVSFGIVALLWIWQKDQFNIERMHINSRELRQPERKRGLILLMSNPDSAMRAIEYHFKDGPLETVWVIPSNNHEEDKFGSPTATTVEQIKDRCKALTAKTNRTLKVISDRSVSPADAQDTFDCVNGIFRNCRGRGWAPVDLIADFTGGTKPMTVGMIMACLPRARELEYIPYHPQKKLMNGPYLIDYQHSAFDLFG